MNIKQEGFIFVIEGEGEDDGFDEVNEWLKQNKIEYLVEHRYGDNYLTARYLVTGEESFMAFKLRWT